MTATEGTQGTSRGVDWERAENSPEFQELVTRRRRFVVPATIFFLVWFLGFILLAGYAQDFMGERITGGLTVGYVLALTQFVMVWVLAFVYIRTAARVYDPLAKRAADEAFEYGLGGDDDRRARSVAPEAGRPVADGQAGAVAARETGR
jgi:uncharacterized membrane protein (DUF485 family)